MQYSMKSGWPLSPTLTLQRENTTREKFNRGQAALKSRRWRTNKISGSKQVLCNSVVKVYKCSWMDYLQWNKDFQFLLHFLCSPHFLSNDNLCHQPLWTVQKWSHLQYYMYVALEKLLEWFKKQPIRQGPIQKLILVLHGSSWNLKPGKGDTSQRGEEIHLEKVVIHITSVCWVKWNLMWEFKIGWPSLC